MKIFQKFFLNMKIHTIAPGRPVWKIRIWSSDFRKSPKLNIQSPKHNFAIYEDFSKILFEYKNSYQRAFEVSFKN